MQVDYADDGDTTFFAIEVVFLVVYSLELAGNMFGFGRSACDASVCAVASDAV